MEKYRRNFTVDIHDVDFNGVARASALMKYIQSAAELQLTDNGMSYKELRDRRRAFILSKIRMEFTDAVRAYEPLSAITFPCPSRGYSFLRCYQLLRDGITVGRAASVWALIDTDERSLVRVNDFELGLTTFPPLDLLPGRIAMPEGLTEVGTWCVGYGDTDQNRHMNNTKYPDMYASFLPISGRRIESITISYVSEAPLGEVLRVERGECDGVYYFRTTREDGRLNTEAEIKLCDI